MSETKTQLPWTSCVGPASGKPTRRQARLVPRPAVTSRLTDCEDNCLAQSTSRAKLMLFSTPKSSQDSMAKNKDWCRKHDSAPAGASPG